MFTRRGNRSELFPDHVNTSWKPFWTISKSCWHCCSRELETVLNRFQIMFTGTGNRSEPFPNHFYWNQKPFWTVSKSCLREPETVLNRF
jgi:hypothetical protein